MKKIFMIALAILISVAFVTTVFAQAPKDAPKPAAAADKPAVDKPAKAEKVEKKAKGKAFTGEVVKAEAAAFVAKDKKGEMTFDVSGVKGYKAEDYKAGDKVLVKYSEKDGKMMAAAIKKAPAKKEKKEEKKEMKKEDKPAAAPADKPAAAPAKK